VIKKLCITAAAAAALSVPLAGAAWAAPDDNNPPGQGTTGPGMPHEIGAFGDAVAAANPNLPPINPRGSGPLPPGQEYSTIAKLPGSTPEAAAAVVNGIYGNYVVPDAPGTPVQTNFEKLAPGLVTKTFTPGCSSGNTATAPAVNGGNSVCH
jgi:hypothetical protein